MNLILCLGFNWDACEGLWGRCIRVFFLAVFRCSRSIGGALEPGLVYVYWVIGESGTSCDWSWGFF